MRQGAGMLLAPRQMALLSVEQGSVGGMLANALMWPVVFAHLKGYPCRCVAIWSSRPDPVSPPAGPAISEM